MPQQATWHKIYENEPTLQATGYPILASSRTLQAVEYLAVKESNTPQQADRAANLQRSSAAGHLHPQGAYPRGSRQISAPARLLASLLAEIKYRQTSYP